jgi:predicted O-methyltransferase YrrM
MTSKTIALTPELYTYLLTTTSRETALLQELRQKTAVLPQGTIHISPDQGQFMSLLIKLMQAEKVLEIGVFTGYSALWLASALPETGKLIACEINASYIAMAQDYWQRAGVLAKIDVHLGPALTTLEKLLASGERESFDVVFIDADKANQANYYELALQLVRSGGLILLDNSFMQGKIVDPKINSNNVEQVRRLNAALQSDERVDLSLLAIGDGLTLLRKR